MSNLIVREVTPQEDEAWNMLVKTSPQGSVFQMSDFLHMLYETDPSLRLTRLGVFNPNGLLKAGQAVLFRRVLGLSIKFDSSYFYTGPLLPQSLRKHRWARAEKEHDYLTTLLNALSSRFPDISWDTHPTLADLRPFTRLGWQATLHYTHTWDLSETHDIRNLTSKGERVCIQTGLDNFAFRQETWEATGGDFMKVFCSAMTKQDWQPNNKWIAIFSNRIQWMEAHGMVTLTTARDHENRLCGGLLTALSREQNTAYIWKEAYDLELARSGIVPALFYASVIALSEDYTCADMAEGMTLNQSRFKDFMGTNLVPYYSVTPPGSRQQKLYSVRKLYRKIIRDYNSFFHAQ